MNMFDTLGHLLLVWLGLQLTSNRNEQARPVPGDEDEIVSPGERAAGLAAPRRTFGWLRRKRPAHEED